MIAPAADGCKRVLGCQHRLDLQNPFCDDLLGLVRNSEDLNQQVVPLVMGGRHADIRIDPALTADLDDEGDRLLEGNVRHAFPLVVGIRLTREHDVAEPAPLILESEGRFQGVANRLNLGLVVQPNEARDVTGYLIRSGTSPDVIWLAVVP